MQVEDPLARLYKEEFSRILTGQKTFLETKQGFLDPSQGFLDQKQGFFDPKASFPDSKQGFPETKQGFLTPTQGLQGSPLNPLFPSFEDLARNPADFQQVGLYLGRIIFR